MGVEKMKGRQLPSSAPHTMHFAPYLTNVWIHPSINRLREAQVPSFTCKKAEA